MSNEQTFKQQVALLLVEADSDVIESFFQSSAPEFDEKYNSEEVNAFCTEATNQGITYKHCDNHGGEGEGEDYWSVFKFTNGTDTVHVKFEGSYQSYNGSEFDEFYFVEPKEVLVTQYFRVKK